MVYGGVDGAVPPVAAAVQWYGSGGYRASRPLWPISCVCNAMEMTSAPIFFKLHTHRE